MDNKYSNMTTEELFFAIKDGDNRAFDVFYKKNYKAILNEVGYILEALEDHMEMRSALNTIWSSIHTEMMNVVEWKGAPQLICFIKQSAVWKAATIRRQHHNKQNKISKDAMIGHISYDELEELPDDLVESSLDNLETREALDYIMEDPYLSLTAAGYTQEEIAKELGLPQSTVSRKIAAAKAYIRERFK